MLGWSPPRILAVIALSFSTILSFSKAPTFAKPYPQQTIRYENIAGVFHELNGGQWSDKVNLENDHGQGRNKRSPTEDVDNTLSAVPARKRHGIETPIQPLATESGGNSISREDTNESLRSKVDQPKSGDSIGLSVDDKDKILSNSQVLVLNNETHNMGSESVIDKTHGHLSFNKNTSESQTNEQPATKKSEGLNGSGEQPKGNVVDVMNRVQDPSAQEQRKADPNTELPNRNQDNNNEASESNNAAGKTDISQKSTINSAEARGRIPSDKESINSSPKVTGKANTANREIQEESNNQNGMASKISTPSQASTGSSAGTKATQANVGSQAASQSNRQAGQTTSSEPIRDTLGTSGSEIVTTTRAPYNDLPYYRDAESKPSSSGPEVGHFQVDDKSADLEINANSAGVKVKAKPASLQVVSRPGSPSSTDVPSARSMYPHYRYPPFYRPHYWRPGRLFGPLQRRHVLRPYPRDWLPFPHRYDYDPEDIDAPSYRRHYRYPHHRRHRYHEPYMFERSWVEAPEHRSRYRYDEPNNDRRYRRRFHRKRFHHMRSPVRHHLYNRYNIPVMNNFALPNMNFAPEADTIPQLPFGSQMTEQIMRSPAQRQNVVTPVPPPINVFGNPPPGVMNGANSNFMGMNGMNAFKEMNEMNEVGASNEFGGINDMNGVNGFNGMGGNSLGLSPIPGLNGGMDERMTSMWGTQGTRRDLGVVMPHPLPEVADRPVKKAAIQSENPHSTKQETNDKKDHKRILKDHSRNKSSKKSHLNLKGWKKILKHRHNSNTIYSKRHRSRRATKLLKDSELKKATHNANFHAQKSKDEKGSRKNAIIIHRPPIIYHPPPEIYHRPDIVVHRAPIMLHRPPIIYHQPPVVVHRPAIIYHQPAVIFHQPPPVVHQPVMHSHDTWVTKPVVYHTNSVVSHAHTYYGVPSQVYSGGCHGPHCAFRKGDVPRNGNTNSTENTVSKLQRKRKIAHNSRGRRDSYQDHMNPLYHIRSAKDKRAIDGPFDFITSNEGAQEKLTYTNTQLGDRLKRDNLYDYYSYLRHTWNPEAKRFAEDEIETKKKKDVVVNRPPIIYHPPPEIYHRPDIVVHRPPLVIHRPPIIYHQPPVIVHRPAVVYHQPPIIFHQPPPAVNQPLLYSHDSFMVHPTVYASHHGSVVRDSGHYIGIPKVITNYGNPLFGMQHPPIGKRSVDKTKQDKTESNATNGKDKGKKRNKVHNRPKNETNEKAGKKNAVVIARPPIIYHPPPEVYHRPIIVVHRAPIMLHRAPIVYHQAPVVVHRPAIVYHQPPLIFHQPPPVVNQPILKSHDTWIRHPVILPYSSHISHHSTYVGIPDQFMTHSFGHYHGHYGHSHAFYKSKVPKTSQPEEEKAIPKSKIEKKSNSTKFTGRHDNEDFKNSLKRKKLSNEKGGKKNAVIVKRPPVIYHPPPEIYHRPDIIVHRAPIMIHRAPIIYHQPAVIVHRPAVVYHQPPLIFHQPPPVIHQTIWKSHDTWVPKPAVRLYSSRVHHAGHMYQIPHAYYHGHGPLHYVAYSKSKVPRKSKLAQETPVTRETIKKSNHHYKKSYKDEGDKDRDRNAKQEHRTLKLSKAKSENEIKIHQYVFHKEKEQTEKGNKKNAVIIHRPPIIYHPPPEVYHRPNIVVHRAPIVLYRAPIIYHQPPVVVHRPAIVYHQPPLVFHQPPPMVHQPILHSHDTWVTKSVARPYATHIHHVATYHGVPHEAIFMHGFGSGTFTKSNVPAKKSRRDQVRKDTKSKRFIGAYARDMGTTTAIGASARIQRAIQDQWRIGREKDISRIEEYPVGARTRISRAVGDPWMSFGQVIVSPTEGFRNRMGAGLRIKRAIDDVRRNSEGENTGNIYRNNEVLADRKDIAKVKDSNTSKKTVLIIQRPPIIYHPPSHVIHRPSIVVHRQPLIVHRHPIIFHRPPILIHRPPIIIHRPPILFRRPPVLVHRPPLMFHRRPFIIHRAPFIIHHHPIMIHRPPIIIHKAPNFLEQHSDYIHHYPMHMMHVHCPGCGIGKSGIARVQGTRNGNAKQRTREDKTHLRVYSNSHTNGKSINISMVAVLTSKTSNRPKRFVSDHIEDKDPEPEKSKRKTVSTHKKKKDVVVNRPPIIYHPPPEVYHRPDIVVHRAPILIHRPPIVYHQPPVIVHRPAVVYHQPPIVFHQPSPAVSQPLLYSHDSFVVHPMAFASHMGSEINDAGNYIGLPHGGISNFPGPLHSQGHVIPSALPSRFSRRGKVEKPMKYAKSSERKPSTKKDKQADGQKKNKVVVQRPPMIYHPPPEIYDRPNIIVHRPDLVFHRPSIVYHQPSVVVHRPPIIYRQPPVVFHQPSPMVSQPIMKTMDTYVAHSIFEPYASHVQHSSTYVGSPHFFPGYNNYGGAMNGNWWGWNGQAAGSDWSHGSSFGPAFGRSEVETNKKKNTSKNEKKDKSYTKSKKAVNRNKRSTKNHKRHHHHHYHHHHHHNSDRNGKGFFSPKRTFYHRGHHRSHVVIINRPPLVYRPPTQIIRRPPIVMPLPPIIYHRPPLVYHTPPTIVHHPAIVYHQAPVVFHNPPPIVNSPVLHSNDIIHSHIHNILLPASSYVHSASNYFGIPQGRIYHGAYSPHSEYSPVVSGPAYSKSKVSKASKTEIEEGTHLKHRQKRDFNEGFKKKNGKPKKGHNINGSKRQYMDLVVHRPPIVFHPPPDIFDKPPVLVRQEPVIVRRPPVMYHLPPLLVHKPPIIYRRPPLVLFHHRRTFYHHRHFGRSVMPRKEHKFSNKVGDDDDSQKSSIPRKSHKGTRKNIVVVQRPPLIYHPPPEIYQKPDVIVHRPNVVIHRPSVVYHQPSVVVHRPSVIYHQPPVVFHQPRPMVNQPIMHSHETYVAQPVPVPYVSSIHHAGTYIGAPHFYGGSQWDDAFLKSSVAKAVDGTVESKREDDTEAHTSSKNNKDRSRRSSATNKAQAGKSLTKATSIRGGTKKNKVVLLRPSLIYHPPPEIYDKPDVIVHRPDLVVHQPSIVYHQPSVVVHRPPVVYHEPPVVFHQPPPMVHQSIMNAHDTYVAHQVPVPYESDIQQTENYVGSPHYFPGRWNYGWGDSHNFAYGKSSVPKNPEKQTKLRDNENNRVTRKAIVMRKGNNENNKPSSNYAEVSGNKKNLVVMRRPPLIYHPPAEIYHRPSVVVHRPDLVIHRPSIVFHQPSVVVHRPAVIYQQPPVVFHQPPPMVNQPILHAHDTYMAHPNFVPYSSHVHHTSTFVGAPHFYPGGWGWGHGHGWSFSHAFGKSKVEKNISNKGNVAVDKTEKDETKHGGRHKSKRSSEVSKEKYTKSHSELRKETMKVRPGHKKNVVVMRRPPLIYHPPAEIYHRPSVVVHRPDLVIHRPSIVFHQPSVVVHRPPVIYHQSPIVFHQPPPMVHQPIFHSYETYLAHPNFLPYMSHVAHAGTYVGAPHAYHGGWGWDHGFGHAFGKSKVENNSNKHKDGKKVNNYKIDSPPTEKAKGRDQRSTTEPDSKDYHNAASRYRRRLRETSNMPMAPAIKSNGSKLQSKNKKTGRGHKKNLVIMRRPPLIYHPPPEVYHRPNVIVHRPDIVIHRPSVVFHQPSVVVHRPSIIYHQPPVIFHQPSPMVHQPILNSHETYLAHPHFVPYTSDVHHEGTYVGAPHSFYGGWGWGHGFGHAFGKSEVQRSVRKNKLKEMHSQKKHEITGQHKKEYAYHPEQGKAENPAKKNSIVVSRPPIIYHPPPEIYHRPDIVVHRAPIVLHRPPIVYHQPPVVVHRPAVVYHQPPIIFHQPLPAIHQPILHSHDSFVVHPETHFIPQGSTVSHTMNFVGIPSNVMQHDESTFHFHRSHIEHGKPTKRKRTSVPVASKKESKSTISKFPLTHKENTQTAITDEAQKKTLRSYIHSSKRKINKRNMLDTHSLFAPVTPFNDVHTAGTIIEQHQKLSTIPGKSPGRQRDVAKRLVDDRRTKRQAVLPTLGGIGYPSSLYSMYNNRALAALQNEAVQETEGPNHLQTADSSHPVDFDGLAQLPHVADPRYPGLPLFRSPLFSPYSAIPPKEESPDVHVHVETTKSAIPYVHTKRQIVPVYAQSQLSSPASHLLFNGLEPLDPLHTINVVPQPDAYHVDSPYQALYHPTQTGLGYDSYSSADGHRPRVSINVQSARSRVPIPTRQIKERTKRQLWGINAPLFPTFPATIAAPSQSYLLHSPNSMVPVLPDLPDPVPPYVPSYGSVYSPHAGIHNIFNPEEREMEYNPLMRYLSALYAAYWGYPFNHRHRKSPKVQVEVHTSRSKIQEIKESSKNPKWSASKSIIPTFLLKRHPNNNTRSRRQLYNYLPMPSLDTGHYTLPTATQDSPQVNINVHTSRRSAIPSIIKKIRSAKRGRRKGKSDLMSSKRDQLQDNEGMFRTGEQDYQEQNEKAPNQALESQYVAGNSNPAEFNKGTSDNEQSQALSQINNMALTQQGPIEQPEQPAQYQNQAQIPQARDQFFPRYLPFQSPFQPNINAFQLNRLPLNAPLLSPIAHFRAQQLQFPMQGAPFPLPFASFPATVPLQVPFAEPSQDIIPVANEKKAGHTSINVQVAKSSVPKKKKGHEASKVSAKRQYLTALPEDTKTVQPRNPFVEYHSQPRVSINVQTYKKSNTGVKKTGSKHDRKRQKITVLNRMSIMQVLPQTFKQNGVNVPSFNTIPINNYAGKDGMRISERRDKETRKERKHNIPSNTETGTSNEMHENTSIQHEESAKKRQFYGFRPQYMIPQDTLFPQGHQTRRPHVSVNVQVGERKSKRPKKRGKSKNEDRQEKGEKRQFHFLPRNSVQKTMEPSELVASLPFDTNLLPEHHHVSVDVEVAKKTSVQPREKERSKEKLETRNKSQIKQEQKRQIYGLPELPHQETVQHFSTDGSIGSTANQLTYYPGQEVVHPVPGQLQQVQVEEASNTPVYPRPHISINVEATKRNEKIQTAANRARRSYSKSLKSSVSQTDSKGDKRQFFEMTRQPDHHLLFPGNQLPVLGTQLMPHQPHVSLNVEVSKRNSHLFKTKGSLHLKRHKSDHQRPKDPNASKRQVIVPWQDINNQGNSPTYVQDVNQESMGQTNQNYQAFPVVQEAHEQRQQMESTQAIEHDSPEQLSQPIPQGEPVPLSQPVQPVSPIAFMQPEQLQAFQQIPHFQHLFPSQHPRVSINVHTAKSTISKQPKTSTPAEKVAKRQMFGTVPLLSPFSQLVVPNRVQEQSRARSTVPQSRRNKNKRQLYGRLPLMHYIQQYHAQQLAGVNPFQAGSALNPYSAMEPKPRVNINVQTARDVIPSPQLSAQKGSKFAKRQFINYLAGQAQHDSPIHQAAYHNDAVPRQQMLQNIQQAQNTDALQTERNQDQEADLQMQLSEQERHVEQAEKEMIAHPGSTQITNGHGTDRNDREDLKKKVRRQLDLLGLGGTLERRGGSKALGTLLKKPGGNSRFVLTSNFNKPINLLATDPVNTNIPGIPQGKIKLQDNPIGVDALPFKGAVESAGVPMPVAMGLPAFDQGSPITQGPIETGAFTKSLGVGPVESMAAPPPPELNILGPAPVSPGILPRDGLSQINPLILGPRVLPISSVIPALIPFDKHPQQEQESLHVPPDAQPSPLLPFFPPFLPLPLPEPSEIHPQPPPYSPLNEVAPSEDRPSVHVKVETAKSHIPKRKSSPKRGLSRGRLG